MSFFQHNKIRYPLVVLTALAVICGTVYFVFFRAETAEAEWFDDSWFYRKKVEITNAGTAQTDFQVAITLDTATLYSAGKIQIDCDDIRITDITGKLLPHWLEPTTCNTASTKIWTKVPSIAASGATIYVYYGNPSAVSVSSTTNTFIREISNVQGAWAMDEASWNNNCSTNTVMDSSNNANHGKSCPAGTGPLGGAAGKFGNGGSFDGDNDYVNAGAGASLGGMSELTIEAWMYKISDGINRGIVAETWNGDSNTTFYLRGQANGQILTGVGDGVDTEWWQPAVTIPNNEWTHYVFVFKGNSYKRVYVNGVQYSTGTSKAQIRSRVHNLWIGHYSNDSSFDGLIDDVRIYNKALSQAEISDLYGTGGDRQGYTTTNYPNIELVRKYSASVSVGSPGTEQQGPGPVAYWRFDEGTGDTTYDDSTNSNNGTRGGGTADYKPTWQTEDMCVSGKCLRFDGTNDYVYVGNNTSLKPTAAITVEAWIKSSSSASQDIYRYRLYGMELYLSSGQPTFDVFVEPAGGTWRAQWTTAISDGKWHHIVGTFGGGTKLYVDGVLRGTAGGSGDTIKYGDGYAAIGRAGDWAGSFFDGTIDGVRIYNYARTAAQIKTDYLSRGASEGVSAKIGNESAWISNGLVGYWKMDEASWTNDCNTSTVIDASGTGNNGKSCPAGTGPTGGAAGKFGNAGSLDGTDEYVDITLGSSLPSGSGSYTVGMWVYPTDLDPSIRRGIFTRGNAATNQLSAIVYNGPGGGLRVNHYDNDLVTSQTLSNNQWSYLTLAYNGATTVLYLNGANIGTLNSGTLNLQNTITRIGDYYNNDVYSKFKGSIDDVRIYNRALSAAEVRALYNFAPGPVGHWKMDEKVSGNSQTVYDSSTYGNNGTTYWGANVSGMDCTKPGKYGTACQFDGTDDYVNVPSTNFGLGLSDGTICHWIKPSVIDVDRDMVLMYKADPYQYWHTRITSTGKLFGGFRWVVGAGFVQVTGNISLPVNTWSFVCIVADRDDKLKLYVNGVADSTGNISGGAATSMQTPTAVAIGKRVLAAEPGWTNGLIDDVRIYNYARTQKQILEDMNAGHPAVGSPVGSYAAYWNFDEGYSNIAHDASVNANNGTLQPGAGGGNTQAYQMWDNNGKFNKAIEFDGTDDYVDAGNGASLNITSAITLEAWVNINSAMDGGVAGIVTKGTGASAATAYSLIFDDREIGGRPANTIQMSAVQATNIYINKNFGLTDTVFDVWHHIVGVFDNSLSGNERVRLYINGVERGSYETFGTFTNGLATVAKNVIIGAFSDSPADIYFNGLIDEVKIYPFALTEDEIRTEYNKGAAIKLGSVSTASDGATASDAASREYCIPGDTTSCNGPVAEWKMDEKASGNGQTVYDTSGYGNNGTTNWGANASGMDCTKLGKNGSACQFDGTDDYVSLGNDKFNLTTFTLEFWIKTGTALKTAFSNYYRAGDGQPEYGFLSHTRPSGKQSLQINENAYDPVSAPVINNNTWHQIAFVVSGATVGFYVDGIYYETYTYPSQPNYSVSVKGYVGTRFSGVEGGFWNGLIDDVRIYNYARTPAQIAWDYNRGGPVGYWEFDECQGGTAYDSSGKGNNGTITIGGGGTQDGIGTCTDGDTTNAWYNGRTGKYNSAMSFDGEDDYVRVAHNSVLTPTIAVTAEAWIKPNTGYGESSPRIIEKDDGKPIRIAIQASNGILSNQIYIGGTARVFYSNTVIPTNVWTHVSVTFDGTTHKIYLNGKIDDEDSTYSGAIGTASGYLYIGDTSDQTRNFNGLIDEVKVFNYPLTADQIQTEYNQGASIRFGPTSGAP